MFNQWLNLLIPWPYLLNKVIFNDLLTVVLESVHILLIFFHSTNTVSDTLDMASLTIMNEVPTSLGVYTLVPDRDNKLVKNKNIY